MKWLGSRKIALAFAGCIIVALSTQTAIGSELIPFVDDFEDGSVSDDVPVSIVSAEIPVSIEISNGDMILSEPLQLAGYSLGLATVTKNGQFVHAQDVSAQSVVRVSDPLTFAGMWTRGQSGADGDGGAYFCNIGGDGVMNVGSFLGEPLSLETPLDPTTSDVVLQLDTIGRHVIATAWPAGNPASKYSITFVDSVARPAGMMGPSFGRLGEDAAGAYATFRSFQVLEPDIIPAEHFFENFTKKPEVTTVVIARHAEKANDTLTAEGEKRAETLARLLSNTGVSAIFSTNYTRTTETANNTAELFGITIQFYASIQGVVDSIKSDYIGEVVLVVGHSNTVSQTAEALGVSSAPQINGEYDNLFVVTIRPDDTASLTHLKYDIHPDL